MQLKISYAGSDVKPRLFGKAFRRILGAQLVEVHEDLMDFAVPVEPPFERIKVFICEELPLGHLEESIEDGLSIAMVGVAPGFSFSREEDDRLAVFAVERVRFYLRHKGLLSREMADLLQSHIDRIRAF